MRAEALPFSTRARAQRLACAYAHWLRKGGGGREEMESSAPLPNFATRELAISNTSAPMSALSSLSLALPLYR